MSFIKYPDLEGKRILVTGAMRGIGKSIAINLAKQGSHVAFNYRGDLTKALEFQKELEEFGGKATPIQFDVTNNEDITIGINAFIAEHGAISGLVNNAGISKDQLVLRLKEDEMMQVINTNLLGSMRVITALSRNFLKAPDASIVNISSVVGLMGNSGQLAYSASKAGVIGMTKTIAKEFASKGVRSNAICPGFIETDMTQALDEKVKENYLKSIPLGKLGTGENVANLVAFLLSSASGYITGEIIKIDGGLYI